MGYDYLNLQKPYITLTQLKPKVLERFIYIYHLLGDSHQATVF